MCSRVSSNRVSKEASQSSHSGSCALTATMAASSERNVLAWRKASSGQFTTSRPYHRNDQALAGAEERHSRKAACWLPSLRRARRDGALSRLYRHQEARSSLRANRPSNSASDRRRFVTKSCTRCRIDWISAASSTSLAAIGSMILRSPWSINPVTYQRRATTLRPPHASDHRSQMLAELVIKPRQVPSIPLNGKRQDPSEECYQDSLQQRKQHRLTINDTSRPARR
jgi:hypothetical protein